MAGTAAYHPHHFHLPAVNRAALRVGWPRRVAAVLMMAVGASFVAVTIVSNLYHVGPAFDRLTDGFRPAMTQQAIQTDRQDLAMLSTAATEIQTKMLPAMAQQLKLTPDQLNTMLNAQFPDVAAGLKAIPASTPAFENLVGTLDANRHNFASADAIPTKSLPATTVPWSFLAVGVIAAALGVIVWFTPRSSAVIATVVGAALIALPLMFGMLGKASDADKLNTNLKPVYNQQLINDANGALKTLSAMGTQMQTTMLPALAAQLKMQPAELQAFIGQNFPATATALKDMPTSLGRFQGLVATFDKHLSDWNTLKPVTFVPIVWLMLSGGAALFLLGAAGVFITWSRREARTS